MNINKVNNFNTIYPNKPEETNKPGDIEKQSVENVENNEDTLNTKTTEKVSELDKTAVIEETDKQDPLKGNNIDIKV